MKRVLLILGVVAFIVFLAAISVRKERSVEAEKLNAEAQREREHRVGRVIKKRQQEKWINNARDAMDKASKQ